jgi:DNA-binding NarL/FixJ family response regulator
VQNYLTEILLGLNLIGLLYLVVIGSFRREVVPQQELHQKIVENQNKVIREIAELKGTMKYNHTSLQQEIEQWRVERQAFEASVKATTKLKNEQNLFLNDRYKEVFDLQKQGLTVEQIAKKLDKGNGEVSFILQLATQEHAKKGV